LKPPGGKERPRERVLTPDEIVKVWRACDPEELGIVFATYVRIVMLTAARRGEVAAMEWDALDLESGLWRIADTKSGRAHEVPLVSSVVELLASMPRREQCRFVFTTNGRTPISGFSKLTSAIVTAAKVDGWTLHDLRRSAATKMTELGVPPDHVERVLGHILPGMRRVYVHHEFLAEKRAALETWAAHVQRVTNQAARLGAA
jgi:integrase